MQRTTDMLLHAAVRAAVDRVYAMLILYSYLFRPCRLAPSTDFDEFHGCSTHIFLVRGSQPSIRVFI